VVEEEEEEEEKEEKSFTKIARLFDSCFYNRKNMVGILIKCQFCYLSVHQSKKKRKREGDEGKEGTKILLNVTMH
jgi:hypothetical protein